MAITFRAGASNLVSGGTSIIVNKPSGTTTNDIMICSLELLDTNLRTVTAPSGWTLVTSNGSGGHQRHYLYYKIAGASEGASYQWSFSGTLSAQGAATIVSYSGVDTSDAIDDSSNTLDTSWSKSLTGGSVDITQADSIVLFFAYNGSNRTLSTPNGWTSKYTYNNTVSGLYATYNIVEKDYSSGSTGDISFTLSNYTDDKNAFGVVLNPASASANTSAFFQLF